MELQRVSKDTKTAENSRFAGKNSCREPESVRAETTEGYWRLHKLKSFHLSTCKLDRARCTRRRQFLRHCFQSSRRLPDVFCSWPRSNNFFSHDSYGLKTQLAPGLEIGRASITVYGHGCNRRLPIEAGSPKFHVEADLGIFWAINFFGDPGVLCCITVAAVRFSGRLPFWFIVQGFIKLFWTRWFGAIKFSGEKERTHSSALNFDRP